MPIATGSPIGLLLALTYTVDSGVTLTIADSWHAHFADGPVDVAPFVPYSNEDIELWWEQWIGARRKKRKFGKRR